MGLEDGRASCKKEACSIQTCLKKNNYSIQRYSYRGFNRIVEHTHSFCALTVPQVLGTIFLNKQCVASLAIV